MQIRILLAAGLLAMAGAAHAADIDLKLTTTDGSTKMSVVDSGSVEVASVTSDGDAFFNTIKQSGTGGNLILNRSALQTGATFYVSSGTIAEQLTVGDVLLAGTAGSNTDSYLALPFTAGAAITTKQAVTLNTAGQVVTNTTNSTNTVVGITVTATSGGSQKIYVAVSGIVTNVTCQAALGAGAFVCNGGTTAGRVGTCSSLTNNAIMLGRMISACTAGGTGTMLVAPK